MSNEDEYERYLRRKAEEDLNKDNEKREKEMRARIREFEERTTQKFREDTERMQKKKQEELEEIRKKFEETKKKIDTIDSAEKAKQAEMIAQMKASEAAEMARLEKEYEEIIQKNVDELKKERLAVETHILDADIERIKVHREFEETKIQHLREMQEKREKIAEEQREKADNRQKEVLNKEAECLKEKLNNEKVIAKQVEEHTEKAIQLRSDLEDVNLRAIAQSFQTLVLRMEQNAARALNNDIKRMGEITNSAISHYQSCIRFMSDALTDAQKQRASESFENLAEKIHSLSGHLNQMKRRLAEVDASDEKERVVKGVQDVGAKIFPLSTCIARFSGRLMTGSCVKNEEDQALLGTLMNELFILVDNFREVDAKNKQMETHIRHPIEKVEVKKNEQKRLEGAETSSDSKQ